MSSTFWGIFFGLAAGAFWGLSFLIPISFAELSPGALALARCTGFAFISFAALAKAGKLELLRSEGWKTAAWFSITGYSVYYFLLIYSIRFAGIPASSLIIGLLPITISLMSRDKVHRPGLFRASLVLILAGIAMLNYDGFAAFTGESAGRVIFFIGVALSVVSLVVWTLFAVQNSRYLKSHPEVDNASWAAVIGVYSLITMIPLAVIDVMIVDSPTTSASFETKACYQFTIAAVVLGFGCSYIATRFWNIASRNLPTGLVGQLIVSETVFALLYGYIYDFKLPTAVEATCIALLIGGVVLGIRSFVQRPVS